MSCVCNILQTDELKFLLIARINHFEARLILSQKVDSKVLRMSIWLKYFDKKKAKSQLQCMQFRQFLFGFSPDVKQ